MLSGATLYTSPMRLPPIPFNLYLLLLAAALLLTLVQVGLLGIAALLALPTSGGSVLVQANLQGYAWTFGPVLIAAVVLGWPRLPHRREHRMDDENSKGVQAQ